MAILHGPLSLTGKLGPLSIYKDKSGRTIVRHKTGPSRKKVKTSGSYSLFRKSSGELSLASSSGKHLRIALREINSFCSDGSLYYRMNSTLRAIMKTDPVSLLGQRLISLGDPAPLEDLEWNINLPLEAAFQADFSGAIETTSGALNVIISSFTPTAHINAPEGATHFELISAAVAWHPEKKAVTPAFQRSGPKPLTSKTVKSQTFQFDPLAASYPILFIGLGIIFSSRSGQKMAPLKGGAFRILKAHSKTAKT